MRITFIDPVNFPYTPETPAKLPLGGIRSAVSYLTVALAARGHEVTLLNRAPESVWYKNVLTKPLPAKPTIEELNRPDAVIVANAPKGCLALRQAGVTAPKILWAHHATDDEEIEPLGTAEFRDGWDAFAMVSGWQRDQYVKDFGIRQERMTVLRNAISPIFESVQPDYGWLTKSDVKLAYTSTPYRGLHLLLMLMPTLHTKMPKARLSVFSGQTGYALAEENDPYRIYYNLAHALPGVDYYGSIPQTDLAAALPGHAALAYPSIFHETSCIAAMEAMAAGLLPIITDFGALPETVGKFGFILPNTSHRRAPIELMHDYLNFVLAVITKAKQQPDATVIRLEQQISHVRENYTWAKRAKEWEDYLTRLISSPS